MYLQHVLPLRFHEIHKLRILVIISYDYWSTHIVYCTCSIILIIVWGLTPCRQSPCPNLFYLLTLGWEKGLDSEIITDP